MKNSQLFFIPPHCALRVHQVMNNAQQSLALNTGAEMPVIGLGTWKSEPSEAGDAVTYAISECGYRHIDCAWIYGNEPEIGAAFKKLFGSNTAKREDIFITSKLWNSFHARESVAPACKETLRNLNLDYLDLYLMHWGVATPAGEAEPVDEKGVLVTEKVSIRETWEGMEALVDSGLVKAIGVSNFTGPMLIDLLSYARIPPAVNQIELHPYLQQSRLVEFCASHNIIVTAYSPLGRPGAAPPRPFLKNEQAMRLVDEPVVAGIAEHHHKTPAQILLRWAIQRGTIAIPKSTHEERFKENISVFDFELSEGDMQRLAELNKDFRFVDPYAWWKIPYFN